MRTLTPRFPSWRHLRAFGCHHFLQKNHAFLRTLDTLTWKLEAPQTLYSLTTSELIIDMSEFTTRYNRHRELWFSRWCGNRMTVHCSISGYVFHRSLLRRRSAETLAEWHWTRKRLRRVFEQLLRVNGSVIEQGAIWWEGQGGSIFVLRAFWEVVMD
ncbi:hypothetical protein K491DRAFT_691245 [Lophiostoma macrostomum CBS 122681]|uniref:Uncharacterized protein n=1 Tax=Lophiostoma macrostomum CBS 122681 TaxID=1314788 RepID=A0A6A6TD14_9PLEO|nr:hypothetical protein K491DRAFT_691245 [Lophiostoma macrostomum CBS 122681]